MDYLGEELESLKEAGNYYSWLLQEFKTYVSGNVLEIGAGSGNFSQFLLQTRLTQLTCLEPAGNLIPLLRSRVGDPRVHVRQEGFPGASMTDPLDTVVCVNVLEHLKDDRTALDSIYSMLVPGGHLCLFVPALPWLFGTLDEAFGHYRRYRRGPLQALVLGARFRILRCTYVNLAGVLTWFLMGRVLKRRTWRSNEVRLYDRRVIPCLRWIEGCIAPPLGQSLLLVAQRPLRR